METLSVDPVASAGSQKGQGVCAIVLYDYEAEEDNEMPLTEGETIEQIEEVDEGENYFLVHISHIG